MFVLLERNSRSSDCNPTTTILDKTETMNKHYNVEERKNKLKASNLKHKITS